MTTAQHLTSVGAGRAEWQTPPELYAQLHRRYRFNYDPFASHDNHLAGLYSTIDGTFLNSDWISEPTQVSEYDGLNYDWKERRVFMNPPYSRGFLRQACLKATIERNDAQIIVALLPAATDTAWFQSFVLNQADIEFLGGRVDFIDPETGDPGGNPPGGSIIAVYRG
jgi:phage N-6-adenine-methyltransferase